MDHKGDGTTVQRQRFDVSDPAPSTFVLRVVEGPDRGASFVIGGGGGPVHAGKSEACEIRLTDPEASRRHASFEVGTNRVRVIDLGSTNGTILENVNIVDAYLRVGQAVQLGATTLRLERAPAGAARKPLSDATSFGRLLGRSVEMRRLYPLFERLALSDVPVIIEGETGTGKELLAETLHESGRRASGPFVVLDCATLPANAASGLEERLFGRLHGPPGVFEQAHGGTLFLDEIGDLDAMMQPKLLRAIERAEVVRVGDVNPIRFDVRVIAATHRDIDREIQAERFREDLYHRLAVARIELPPLRKRRGDVELLATHFAGPSFGGALDALLMSRWQDYAWPGNVRELKNAIARRLALGEIATAEPCVDSERMPIEAAAPQAGKPIGRFVEEALAQTMPLGASRQRVVELYDRLYIEGVLAKHNGHVLRAASEAGVARRYFQILKARQAK
jgi:two-component system, NtrC family, response regulator HydG